MNRAIAGIAVVLLGICGAALGQSVEAVPPPDMAEAALRVIGLEYLTDEERSEKRVFHGVWTEDDLDRAQQRAMAALAVGALYDESLTDGAGSGEDRAEAMVRLGFGRGALEALVGAQSARASRLRAESYEMLGEDAAALGAAAQVIALYATKQADTAGLMVEVVRAMRVRARIEGRPGGEYLSMVERLAEAQQDMDRLYWPALVEQAEILFSKDNRKEAKEAAVEVLTLNPNAARAWRVIGLVSVRSFDFATAQAVAARLDENLRRLTGEDEAVSEYGAELRARAALRQKDGLGAAAELDASQAWYPGSARLGALRVAAVALEFNEQKLEEAFAGFDAAWPGSGEGLYEAGRVLSESRQYAWAARVLDRAIARRPNWAQVWIEKGLLEVQSGRDMEAITALRRARELDPFNKRANNSLLLLDELAGYERVEGEHFMVRFEAGVDAVMAREMLGPLDEMHRVVAGVFGWEPEGKTLIELMPDHQRFAVRIVGMPGVHTIAASTGPVVAMEVPKVGKLHEGVYDWIRVVRHEYTHTITLGRTNNRIPHWFTEAAAVNMELSPRDYNTWQLLAAAHDAGRLFDLSEINIAFVRPKRATDRSQAYAQGHWMYQFIVERWGEAAPLQLMDMYRDGIREDRAFESVLGLTGEAFLAAFDVWALEDLRAHGMLIEPSIREMLWDDAVETEAGREKIGAWMRKASAWFTMRMGGMRVRALGAVDLDSPTIEQVQRWYEVRPEHPDVLALLAEGTIGRTPTTLSEADMKLLERYGRVRAVDPMPHQVLARFYMETDDPSRAIPHLEYLDAREQRSAAYAVELARLYAAGGEWDRAWAKSVRAISIAPFDGDHRELAATVAIRRGDLASAEEQLVALSDLEPDREQHKKRIEALRAMRERS
jgi:tetratricopeptide (TPR) repeat protein